MVKINDFHGSNDDDLEVIRKKLQNAATYFCELAEQHTKDTDEWIVCPCPICQIAAAASAFQAVVCSAAQFAVEGRPEMFRELTKMMSTLCKTHEPLTGEKH